MPSNHGTLWSWAKQRWVTAGEHMTAQGAPVYQCASVPRLFPLQGHLRELAPRDGKKVAGNGIHLAAFGAWYAFCMSYCVPRHMVLRFTTLVPAFSVNEASDDDVPPAGGECQQPAVRVAGAPRKRKRKLPSCANAA